MMKEAALSSQRTMEIVAAFARSLDREDYDAARAFLGADCVYDTGKEVLTGPDAVVGSYQAAGVWVRRTFDDVRYESAVDVLAPGRASIQYTDYLVLAGGRAHRHRCRQEIAIDDVGTIRHIVHQEIPGESESLDGFFESCGIPRRGA